MRIDTHRFCAMMIAILATETVFSLVVCFAQAKPLPSTTREATVRRFLQKGEAGGRLNLDNTARYLAAFVNLKDDSTEQVIVYFTYSRLSCGTAGCTMLVLVPDNSSYKIVSRTVATRPPIRVLASKSHGWHDIAVWSQWDGEHAHEVKLSFNGTSYPFSTSSPRAQRIVGKVAGEVVVPSTSEGTPIF